uniref:cellulase n=1 Tax=Solanum tuberosum TaxID=4113 RepID=M1BAS5_SOLTU
MKWCIDYLWKASVRCNCLYVQVGDQVNNHECWTRPENIKTLRTMLMIDQKILEQRLLLRLLQQWLLLLLYFVELIVPIPLDFSIKPNR